ncbi:MAG TPA: ribbon-helix-helix protein, CopG family [Candidatus Polarisedimenticolia bacterium]|nr:ribbon-helix-helix protein, CopG family [Candidatus Polarisedimenticolia bacterium]
MKRPRRATVRLDPELHRALREEAARNDRSISELVNTTLRRTLGEYPRPPLPPKTPDLLFESVLKGLKRRRKI